MVLGGAQEAMSPAERQAEIEMLKAQLAAAEARVERESAKAERAIGAFATLADKLDALATPRPWWRRPWWR